MANNLNSLSSLKSFSLNDLSYRNITPGAFRLSLALLVMVYHSVGFLTIGHYAVFVFFMLSGYWIFKMYEEKYKHYRNSYYVYLTSRLLRILPLYWLILAFSVILYIWVPPVAYKIDGLSDQYIKMFILNTSIIGLGFTPYMYVGTAWTLDIEVQFYILAPLLLLMCRKKIAGTLVLLGFSALSLMLIFERSPLFHVNTIFIYISYFLIGGMIYLWDLRFSLKVVKYCLWAIIAILLLNYLLPSIRDFYFLDRKAFFMGFNYHESINVLLTLLTIPFISYNVRKTTLNRKLDVLMSSMSYTIYLLHWPLLQFYAFSVQNVSFTQKFMHLIFYYIITVVISYFLSSILDEKFEFVRKKWLSKQSLKGPIVPL